MNIKSIGKQFDRLRHIDSYNDYYYEPHFEKLDKSWKRHVDFKDIKEEFIEELTIYGFSPFSHQPYIIQKKNNDIMKYRGRNFNHGLNNFVKAQNSKVFNFKTIKPKKKMHGYALETHLRTCQRKKSEIEKRELEKKKRTGEKKPKQMFLEKVLAHLSLPNRAGILSESQSTTSVNSHRNPQRRQSILSINTDKSQFTLNEKQLRLDRSSTTTANNCSRAYKNINFLQGRTFSTATNFTTIKTGPIKRSAVIDKIQREIELSPKSIFQRAKRIRNSASKKRRNVKLVI